MPADKQKYVNLVGKITMHCKRLPLALCLMGSIVAGFHTMVEWQSCVQKLQDTGSSFGGGYGNELFYMMHKSYENPDDALKSFFFVRWGTHRIVMWE